MGNLRETPRGARLRARSLGLIVSLAAVLMLASCESVDEGAADYRKADINAASGDGKPTDISKKYTLTGPIAPKADANAATRPDGDVPILDGEKFYISLLQAYVGPDAKFNGTLGLGGKEEIVLVLRVRDSNVPGDPGRFVFYSDDVERGQFLNFSNVLTLGPADYKGGVITIDVDEIRLAGSTKHIKDMLGELAGKEGEAFGPDPDKRANWNALARNVFDIIDSDSYGTRYTLTLMPAGGVQNLPYPRFEAGNYVLMRHERRREEFDWHSVRLDNNTGRLINTSQVQDEFRDTSYVTLQINALRNIPTGKPEPKPIAPPKYESLDRATRAR